MRTAQDRLDEKYEPEPMSGCWIWLGSRTNKNYGEMTMPNGHNGKRMLAHRVSWMLSRGPIPSDRWVLHRCDNPPCINPAHLFLGTRADNQQDMMRKGRARGQFETSGYYSRRRLTWDDIVAIRRLAAAGITQAHIAVQFGINFHYVWKLVHNLRRQTA